MQTNKRYTLAIEAAIRGGSISLLDGVKEVGSWIGSSNVSKAEDLLANIDKLLCESSVSRREIGHIAVSAGPGSFTGIRIGLATALGLKCGLDIEMSSETALRAMAFGNNSPEPTTIALPVGREVVCVQSFSKSNFKFVTTSEPLTISEKDFETLVLDGKSESKFLIHGFLYQNIRTSPRVKNFGENIALAIAHICGQNLGKLASPLFISKSF